MSELMEKLMENTEDQVTCKTCKHFIGAGDWNLCCDLRYDLCYKNTPACNQYEGVEEK